LDETGEFALVDGEGFPVDDGALRHLADLQLPGTSLDPDLAMPYRGTLRIGDRRRGQGEHENEAGGHDPEGKGHCGASGHEGFDFRRAIPDG
jgi:hypothetical protein